MSSEAFTNFALAFLSILLEGAPFILLGTVFSGFLGVYLPSGAMEKILPKNKTAAILISGLLGLILPVCECAVVPVIRRLVAKGLPLSCALTYMLAAPIVNPITLLSTWNAFPDLETFPDRTAFFTWSRLGLGYLSAIIVGLLVLRIPFDKILKPHILKKPERSAEHQLRTNHNHDHQDTHHHSSCDHHHDAEHSHHHESESQLHEHVVSKETQQSLNRLVLAMRAALKDFTDVGVYFTIGVIITALFNVGIAPGAEWLESMEGSTFAQTSAFMLLAFLLSLCSTSDAFIAATLAPPPGARTAARLAFLVFGPMMDVKLIFLYSTLMKPKFIASLALGLFLFIGLTAIAWTTLMAPV
ncbi:MAG: permease [Verrucomicrobiota bacterium]